MRATFDRLALVTVVHKTPRPARLALIVEAFAVVTQPKAAYELPCVIAFVSRLLTANATLNPGVRLTEATFGNESPAATRVCRSVSATALSRSHLRYIIHRLDLCDMDQRPSPLTWQ
jgi:hypothetical protein